MTEWIFNIRILNFLDLAFMTKPASLLDTEQKSLLSHKVKQKTRKYGRDDIHKAYLEQNMIEWVAGDLVTLNCTIKSILEISLTTQPKVQSSNYG